MTTLSMDGSEWSGINQYQSSSGKSEPSLSPNPINQGNLPTPPASGSLLFNALGSNPPDTKALAPPLRSNTSVSQNPSPPSSVVSAPRSRASDGTLSDQNSRKYKRMLDLSVQHYSALRNFLRSARGNEGASDIRKDRAISKLQRFAPVHFLELSTDVYDELQRRQAAAALKRPGPPRPDVPPHLLPRSDFHEKRNGAREKLALLQPQRFRELATDLFYEHERRFPQVASLAPEMNGRRASPAPSVRSRYGPGGPDGPQPRSSSRGPAPPGGRGYPPGPPNGVGGGGGGPNGRFPPRQGSLSTGPPAGLGINGETIPENAPYQKTFQSNTIVPNKSTLVEDDESAGFDDDDENNRRSDAFALDRVLESRRGTAATLGVGLSEQDRRKLAETEAQVATLRSTVQELELLLKAKEEEIEGLRESDGSKSNDLESEKRQWEEFKNGLTKQLSDARSLNEFLRNDLDNARRQQDTMEREMQEQLEQMQMQLEQQQREQQQQQQDRQADAVGMADSDDGEWKLRFEALDKEHQALKAEFQKQQEVTEQVRQQALNSLEEMRVLASGSNWEQEESLTREVQRLENEVKQWKNRYAKSKTQQRHLRSSSLGLPGQIQDAMVFAKEHDLVRPDGLVRDVHVTKFQIAIDELLRIARSDEPSLVLEQMKAVVVAVRRISQDIEAVHGKGDDYGQPRNRARSRVSATANNLITASKNFANSNGLSPVSLLDAAASHLTAAVVELLRNVKIRITPENELEEENELDDLAPMQSPGYFSTAPSQSRFSGNESVYSAISTPSLRSRSQTLSRITGARNTTRTSGQSMGGMKNGFGGLLSNGNGGAPPPPPPRGPDRELEELRIYLEDQTEGLVQSIQALVASIRAEDDMSVVRTHITSISNVVGNVVSCTEGAMAQPNANPALRERAAPVVELLLNCCRELVDAASSQESDGREVTSKLPPIAFQIARETKELVQRVDQLEMESRDDDDFR